MRRPPAAGFSGLTGGYTFYPQSCRSRDLVLALPSAYDKFVVRIKHIPDMAAHRATTNYFG